MLVVFEAAGLAESHLGWLQGNFFGGEPGPTEDDVCEGAQGPLEHSHFFTDDGTFGSHDEHGEEVDHGDYVVVDEDTLAFPSHASEFGYDGDLIVDYQIDGDIVTFDVALPESCADAVNGQVAVPGCGREWSPFLGVVQAFLFGVDRSVAWASFMR